MPLAPQNAFDTPPKAGRAVRDRECLNEIFNNDVRHLIGTAGEVTTLLRNRAAQRRIGIPEDGVELRLRIGVSGRPSNPNRKTLSAESVLDAGLVVLNNSH